MEDQKEKGQSQSQQDPPNSPSSQVPTERGSGEPVRSRWTPKPEQILILESIFNSGMVNPPKDETVRIRKVLEKFGTVGDANVFYWFQNRRSRSRRRQRQMLATAQVSGGANPCHHHQYHYHTNNNNNSSAAAVAAAAAMGFSGSSFTINSSSPSPSSSSISYNLSGSSSSSCGVGGGGQKGFGGFSPSTQMNNFPEIDHTSAASSALYPSDHAPNFNYHSGFGGSNVSGFIRVFINGVATEIPRGPMDIKTVFGEDVMLVHSSGVSVPTNEFGFLMQSLQHGESYFLVSKQTQA